jgi:hypothetical protein
MSSWDRPRRIPYPVAGVWRATMSLRQAFDGRYGTRVDRRYGSSGLRYSYAGEANEYVHGALTCRLQCHCHLLGASRRFLVSTAPRRRTRLSNTMSSWKSTRGEGWRNGSDEPTVAPLSNPVTRVVCILLCRCTTFSHASELSRFRR